MLPGSRLTGTARLTFLGFQIYDARLWAAPTLRGDNYASETFVLELAYLRDFRGEAIAERTIKEMRRVEELPDAAAADWLAQMKRLFPDVKKGDRLGGVHRPGVGIEFFSNGVPSGEIRDAAFARVFMGIWLSPRTSQPEMREHLLGLKRQ